MNTRLRLRFSFLILLTMICTATGVKPPIPINEITRRFARSASTNILKKDLVLGSPETKDTLLFQRNVIREKVPGRVVYEELVFDEEQSTVVSECPYNISAISVLPRDSAKSAGHPLLLYGGVGSPDMYLLFISEKSEKINFEVKIWGRLFDSNDERFNLLEGIPSVTDDLLLYENVQGVPEEGRTTSRTVSYVNPENKGFVITSAQAWDVSTGCKLGGNPSIIEGGVNEENVTILITSENVLGFRYFVLVFGKANTPDEPITSNSTEVESTE